jgi:hypothetical protein
MKLVYRNALHDRLMDEGEKAGLQAERLRGSGNTSAKLQSIGAEQAFYKAAALVNAAEGFDTNGLVATDYHDNLMHDFQVIVVEKDKIIERLKKKVADHNL